MGHLDAAEAATGDPLRQVLAFVDAYYHKAEALTEPYPGCLFASYCYEAGLFDEATLRIIDDTYLQWRSRLGARLERVAEQHPPRIPVSTESLADMLTVIFEGAFIVSKTLKAPGAVAAQIRHYRNYLLLLFGEVD